MFILISPVQITIRSHLKAHLCAFPMQSPSHFPREGSLASPQRGGKEEVGGKEGESSRPERSAGLLCIHCDAGLLCIHCDEGGCFASVAGEDGFRHSGKGWMWADAASPERIGLMA